MCVKEMPNIVGTAAIPRLTHLFFWRLLLMVLREEERERGLEGSEKKNKKKRVRKNKRKEKERKNSLTGCPR